MPDQRGDALGGAGIDQRQQRAGRGLVDLRLEAQHHARQRHFGGAARAHRRRNDAARDLERVARDPVAHRARLALAFLRQRPVEIGAAPDQGFGVGVAQDQQFAGHGGLVGAVVALRGNRARQGPVARPAYCDGREIISIGRLLRIQLKGGFASVLLLE